MLTAGDSNWDDEAKLAPTTVRSKLDLCAQDGDGDEEGFGWLIRRKNC